MYKVVFTDYFLQKNKTLTRKNKELKKRIKKALRLLQEDPFYPSLRTHRVNSRLYGERFSSWVSGDIRVIWDYDEKDTIVIILLDVGSHTGKHKVYN